MQEARTVSLRIHVNEMWFDRRTFDWNLSGAIFWNLPYFVHGMSRASLRRLYTRRERVLMTTRGNEEKLRRC